MAKKAQTGMAKTRTIAVVLPEGPHATVKLNGPTADHWYEQATRTLEDDRLEYAELQADTSLGASHLQVEREGFEPFSRHVDLAQPAEDQQLRVGVPADPGRPQDIILEGLTPLAPPRPALPPVPTREQVCRVRTHFQGIFYDTREFGRFAGDFVMLLRDDDRADAFRLHVAKGDTHVTTEVSSAYREPGVVYPERLRNGHDWTQDLSGLKARCREAIVAGLFVDLALAGDGRSVSDDPQPGEYNDPVGDTYGCEWLMHNFARIGKAFRGDADSACPDGEDLTRYVIFRIGYDAVFYGWGNLPRDQADRDLQPERVLAFGELFRSVLPQGYLGIEHDGGHIPVGEGGREFAGRMQNYDTIYSEFANWPTTGDVTWQIAARLLGPKYRRPPDEPGWDDPSAPWYLAPGTPRGPYYACAFEFSKFPESRGQMPEAETEKARAYYLALGYESWG